MFETMQQQLEILRKVKGVRGCRAHSNVLEGGKKSRFMFVPQEVRTFSDGLSQ